MVGNLLCTRICATLDCSCHTADGVGLYPSARPLVVGLLYYRGPQGSFTVSDLSAGTLLLTLAETWSEVWGDEVGALAPKTFLSFPQKCGIWGDGGELTVFVNFNN